MSKLIWLSKTLQYLDLSLIGLGNKGIKILCRGLIGNDTMLSLILHNNELTGRWVQHLFRAVTSSSLAHLDLSYNNIGNSGIIAFSEHTCWLEEHTCKLKILVLNSCGIKDIGM